MTIETAGDTSRRTSSFVDTNSFVSHPACVTIKHWQLRDLVCKTENLHEVLYVSERVVKSIDTDTGKSSHCAEFSFYPRCLASAFGIVAVGGVQRGQLGFTYRRHDDESNGVDLPVTTVELGGYINNSITLYKPGAASVSALVCNNDHTLRMLDINGSSYSVVETLQLPVPLNHACISPDRKSIIACGDSAHLFVFHPEERKRSDDAWDEATSCLDSPTNLKWTRTATLATSADAGFSTAFSPSGVLFAVAAQDGVASIYDSRYLSTSSSNTSISTRNAPKPMRHIESTRPHEKEGAFRCLKFSSGAEDLLLISEQMGRVHVVDTRRFEDRQILEIPNSVNYRIRSARRRRDNSGNDNSNSQGSASGPSSGTSDASAYSRRRRLMELASSRIAAELSQQGVGGSAYNPTSPSEYVTHDETGEMRRRVNDFSSDSALAEYYYQTQEGRRPSQERSQEAYDDRNDENEVDDDELDDDDRYCVFGDMVVSRSASSSSSNITGRHNNTIDTSATRLIREKEISGIAWSDEDGGSVIVGWDSGIGKWTVDRWGRRIFPSYKMR
ncbi:hypothetical protein V1509DRAFT_651381 [Lipomyces kononenkoae]